MGRIFLNILNKMSQFGHLPAQLGLSSQILKSYAPAYVKSKGGEDGLTHEDIYFLTNQPINIPWLARPPPHGG